MWIKTESWQKMGTFPTSILEDPNVSVGAKGLYFLLYHANSKICALADLHGEWTTTSKEDLDKLYQELVDAGYVSVNRDKNGKITSVKLVKTASKPTPKKEETKKKQEEELQAVTEQVNVVAEKKVENAYTKLSDRIEKWNLPQNVKNLLYNYFLMWLKKEGRFAEANTIRPSIVDHLIGELIAMHLDEDGMLYVIQQSIDRQWFKFVEPKGPIVKRTVGGKQAGFQADGIVSASYTSEEIAKIRQMQQELANNSTEGEAY